MVSVKCDFRFFYVYVFVNLFCSFFSVYLVQKKPNEARAFKNVSGLAGQCSHLKYHLNHFK